MAFWLDGCPQPYTETLETLPGYSRWSVPFILTRRKQQQKDEEICLVVEQSRSFLYLSSFLSFFLF